MKRAKLMLAAIAVFAVIGGAYAFKARNTDKIWVRPVGGTACNLLLPKFTTIPNGTTYTTYLTDVEGLPCVRQYYYTGQ